jgi:hypothetical protein
LVGADEFTFKYLSRESIAGQGHCLDQRADG